MAGDGPAAAAPQLRRPSVPTWAATLLSTHHAVLRRTAASDDQVDQAQLVLDARLQEKASKAATLKWVLGCEVWGT